MKDDICCLDIPVCFLRKCWQIHNSVRRKQVLLYTVDTLVIFVQVDG